MLDSVVIRRIRTAARRFAGANEGNIAILFGIAVIPIISFVGAAIDYTRANAARSSMQAALDSTSLMLSKDLSEGTITTSQLTDKADAYFRALYTNLEAKAVTISATYTQNSGNGSTILVKGAGNIDTGFMRLVGFPTMDFQTNSTAAWGNVRMRVAMVLDVTGSMDDDGKMPAMQKAAKALVDQLGALAKNPEDIYISMVPFAKDVNIGSSFYNTDWIDWSIWDGQTATKTWGTCSKSSYTDRTTCQSNNKTWTPDRSKWNGCVTDRTQDYDVKNTAPVSTIAGTKVPAEEYTSGSTNYCKTGSSKYVAPIVPLSNSWSTIKSAIDKLEPTGNTNQGLGLFWGWQTLGVGVVPFNAPAKDNLNYAYKDAIVLLSDGLNTQNRWYSSTSQIDARQKLLCGNAKGTPNNIIIYTVQVDTGGDGESTVLKECASSSDKYFRITDPNQTLSVFNTIG
ncbi:MAG: pilus assembly protein, partial [Bradyrhizobium sp.]